MCNLKLNCAIGNSTILHCYILKMYPLSGFELMYIFKPLFIRDLSSPSDNKPNEFNSFMK